MNQLAKVAPAEKVRAALTSAIPDLNRYLPPGVSPQRFQAVVVTAILQNRDLMECDRESLWQACRRAAQSGLMPDGKEGALVPRWDKKKGCKVAHWMPMVAGLIAMAKRKGSVVSLTANIAYEGETFRVVLGDDEKIEHERDLTKTRGKPIAAYAIARLANGAIEREVMSWDQVMEVRKVGADRGPWETWADEMARKTVIRRLAKRLPALEEGDDALREQIETVDELYDFDGKAEAVPDAEAAPVLDAAAEPVFTVLRFNGEVWTTGAPEKWAEACRRAIAKIAPDGAAALVRWRDAMAEHIAAVPPPHGEEVAGALSDALDAAAEREAIQAEPPL